MRRAVNMSGANSAERGKNCTRRAVARPYTLNFANSAGRFRPAPFAKYARR